MVTSIKDRQQVYSDLFYRETDRSKRREMQARLVEEEGTTEKSECRKRLMDVRYDKKDGNDIDYFIRGWVELSCIRDKGLFPGRKKAGARTAAEALKLWHQEEMLAKGREGELALCGELYNLTKFYIQLCKKDKVYGSVLWGIGHISEEKLAGKIASEIKRVTETIPEWLEMGDEFTLFKEAALRAYQDYFPETGV